MAKEAADARARLPRFGNAREVDILVSTAQAKARSSQAASAAKEMTGRMRQVAAAITAARGKTEALEKAYLLKKQTLELLPDAANHIASLQKICATSAGKLVSLAAEWEKHRRPKIEAIRQHKESRSLRKVRGWAAQHRTLVA